MKKVFKVNFKDDDEGEGEGGEAVENIEDASEPSSDEPSGNFV